MIALQTRVTMSMQHRAVPTRHMFETCMLSDVEPDFVLPKLLSSPGQWRLDVISKSLYAFSTRLFHYPIKAF
jgi:hypothetical protein